MTTTARAAETEQATSGVRTSGILSLLPPDRRRLGGALDVRESGHRVVRYQMVSFAVMRLLGGWLAQIPEYELKLEIGRHVWQDAQAAEALRIRTGELRVPVDADRRPPVEIQRWLDMLDQATTPLQFLVGIYRVAKPRLVSAMLLHMESTDPVCDAPTIRTLRPLVQELGDQIRWGEAAIAAVASDDSAGLAAAATWQAHLEEVLTEAGGLLAEGTPQPPDPAAKDDGLASLPAARQPRSERMLVAARDARFYIDLSPRHLPEDDDPPELAELEEALAERRRTSGRAAESETHAPQGEHGQPPPVRLAQRDARFDMVSPPEQAQRMRPPGDD